MSDTTHLDPFADREADNYDNPIPSREYILEFLTQANVPMNRNDLFEALKLEGEEQYEGCVVACGQWNEMANWCSRAVNAMPCQKNWKW